MDADAWDRRYADVELVWSAGPNRFVVDEVAGLGPGRALDVAAGEGRNAIWLAQQGWRVDATDFSPVGVAKGRELAAHRGVEVAWSVSDAIADPWPGEGYDLVLVVYLHLEPDQSRAVLERSAAALGQGGTLVIIGHHVDNIDHGYGGPPVPEILHDPDRIAAELETFDGVAVERAEQVERPVSTDDGQRVALDSLVRATRSR